MGQYKNYLLRLQENVSDELFPQEAVEWAVMSGWVTLTGDLDTDIHAIMGEGGVNYDAIIVAYRKRKAELEEQTVVAFGPLLKQIAQPIQPIRTTHENITADVLETPGQRGTTPKIAAPKRGVDDHRQIQRVDVMAAHAEQGDVQPA